MSGWWWSLFGILITRDNSRSVRCLARSSTTRTTLCLHRCAVPPTNRRSTCCGTEELDPPRVPSYPVCFVSRISTVEKEGSLSSPICRCAWKASTDSSFLSLRLWGVSSQGGRFFLMRLILCPSFPHYPPLIPLRIPPANRPCPFPPVPPPLHPEIESSNARPCSRKSSLCTLPRNSPGWKSPPSCLDRLRSKVSRFVSGRNCDPSVGPTDPSGIEVLPHRQSFTVLEETMVVLETYTRHSPPLLPTFRIAPSYHLFIRSRSKYHL